jgi:WD40 repeat protein
LLHTLGGHSGEVRTIVPSPDGQWIATADGFPCTSRCQTLIWNAESGELLRTLRGHTDSINSVSLSPDGQWLLTTSNDGTARVWDVESGGLRALLPHSDFVTNAAFSPDGLWVVTTSSDGKARVWPFDPQVLMAIARRHIQRDPPELTCDERATYLHQASPCSTSTPGP